MVEPIMEISMKSKIENNEYVLPEIEHLIKQMKEGKFEGVIIIHNHYTEKTGVYICGGGIKCFLDIIDDCTSTIKNLMNIIKK